ncbi:unnamed protein product [Coregonus sp. 'balchen']|nr:unnamed protein product [Coregonus sp. 'balchen']
MDEERYDLGSKVGKSDKEVGLYLIYCSDKEDKESVGDWRKNIEDKSDRKKMFETV